MWIARDENGEVYLYERIPKKGLHMFLSANSGSPSMYLGKKETYPELTWENSPQEIKLTFPTTGLDRGRRDSIVRGLKKLEEDYMLNYGEEIDWLNKLID